MSKHSRIETTDHKESKNIWKEFLNLALKILVISLIGYIVFGVLFGIRRMNDQSMNPSIKEGSLIVFYRMDKNYNVGDVIVFENNNKEYILRIVAKSGQEVNINEDSELLVDKLPEEHQTFYETKAKEESNIEYPYIVETGKVFVMSDYRLTKDDSRMFGAVPIEKIKGKVIGKVQIRNI